ncbi:MAG: hypothetical protein GXY34_00805 [Syntrophomonadaceae bacterium]|nr:hypothetical protein [Syntrophomonadaceae bacterium]
MSSKIPVILFFASSCLLVYWYVSNPGDIVGRLNQRPTNIVSRLYRLINAPIKRDLRRAGVFVKITPERMATIMGAGAVLGLLIGFVLNNPVVALMLAAAGFIAPRFWLKNRIVEMQNTITGLASVCIHSLITNFQFGVSLPNLKKAAEQIPEPLNEHFERVTAQLLAGHTDEAIYQEFTEKIENRYLRFALKNILVALRTGSDIGPILFNLMDSVQEEKLRVAKIKKASSEARFMALVSTGITFFIIGGYAVLSPQFLVIYTTEFAGKVAVAILTGVILFALYKFNDIKQIDN